MIKIRKDQQQDCIDLANILVDNDRIINRFGESDKKRKENIYYGKMGEVAFYNYLTESGISIDYSAIFSIKADSYDFIMPNGSLTIDVKTIRPGHRDILQPKDQQVKDYIVGVQISGLMANILGYINRINYIKYTDDIISNSMHYPCYNCKVGDLKDAGIIIKNWYF